MNRSSGDKSVREGAPAKRAAILASARTLFLRDGYERTSMDAVAADAQVSKRTVYDYFGDKERLLVGVVEDAAQSLLHSLDDALAAHLSDDSRIRTTEELERALLAFVVELATTIVASADYAVAFRLVQEHRSQHPVLDSLLLSTAPERAIAERFAHFGEVGLLHVPDAPLAADHFNALTMLLAYDNQPDPASADPQQVQRSMTEGVRAFMRAYAPRS
jgi:TetR/AcrR family transcriptional regulator, mexJK operon transcriptional repressor